MKTQPAPRLLKVFSLACALGVLPSMSVMAQSDSASAQEKIELLSSALRAKDSGDLLTAKERLEELIRLSPNDPSVQSLLARVNRELAGGGVALPTAGAVPSNDLGEIDRLVLAAQVSQREAASSASGKIDDAMDLAESGAFEAAQSSLESIAASLTPGVITQDAITSVQEALEEVSEMKVEAAIEDGDLSEAEAFLATHIARFGASAATVRLEESIKESASSMGEMALREVSPQFIAELESVEELMLQARIQFVNGDLDGASETLKDVEIIDPANAAAKRFQEIIAERKSDAAGIARYRTRAEMLNEVSDSWNRPRAGIERIEVGDEGPEPNQAILEFLRETMIPRISFSGQQLSRVLASLTELSIEYAPKNPDGSPAGLSGVNIVPNYSVEQSQDPAISLTLFNASLERILSLITQQANYEYIIEQDVVIVRPGTGPGVSGQLITEFFPISRAIVLRLTGLGRETSSSSSSAVSDPFAPPSVSPVGSSSSGSDEEDRIKSFFERAGVPFGSVAGASLAFDGTQLIVTQSVQNLERLRNILRRYDQTKQVEIESKFLEVQQGVLEELGFQWSIGSDGFPRIDTDGNAILDADGRPEFTYDKSFNTDPETLADRFSVNPDSTITQIVTPTQTLSVSNNPPTIPNTLDFAADASPIANLVGTIGQADVRLLINALERHGGSDLMSAPRLTVLSGKTAQITVAQELIYPESYGDIQATASGGGGGGNNNNNNGNSSIAITAATPQDFNFRNVGVEMEVTPTVEDNDNISLLLEPKVTEFEGFVEYGGPSVALSGDNTVTVPPGFYQPIFSTRSVRTEVTVYDGATVVIGGLVREEVKFVEDKVPVLGDIPVVGRLFRNKGETSLKRNLMIFVSANLISPGGSPSRQSYRGVESNSLFQNPIILTPGGSEERN